MLGRVPDAGNTPVLFFWLWLGGGFIIPGVLAFLAWQSSAGRAPQLVAGLLYLAALVLGSEVLARGVLCTMAVLV